MAEEEEKLAPAAEEVEKDEDAVKEENTKHEDDTLPEPTKVEEGAKEKTEPEQLGASNTTESSHISNPKQSLNVDPVVQPLLTGKTCIFISIFNYGSLDIVYIVDYLNH